MSIMKVRNPAMVDRVERKGGRMERKRKLIPLDESQKGVSEMLFAESLPVNPRYEMTLSQVGALGDFISTNNEAGIDPLFKAIRYAFKLGYMKGHNAAKAEARMKQKEMVYGVDDEEESIEV